MSAIADAPNGSVTIHSSTQTPSFVRAEIARLLGWPENRVRVRTAFLGGGFGAKVYVKMEALAVALSLLAAPSGEGRADDGGAVLHDLEARQHVPHQELR